MVYIKDVESENIKICVFQDGLGRWDGEHGNIVNGQHGEVGNLRVRESLANTKVHVVVDDHRQRLLAIVIQVGSILDIRKCRVRSGQRRSKNHVFVSFPVARRKRQPISRRQTDRAVLDFDRHRECIIFRNLLVDVFH